MAYYNFKGEAVDKATYDAQFGGGGTISGLQHSLYKAAAAKGAQIGTARATIDAEEDANAMENLAARNEATAARQNQSALMNREGTRAGGGRYRRRGMFMAGGSGLNAANANALTAARKRARYAQLDQQQAQQPSGYGFKIGAPIYV